jgi:hypothetical protein
MLVGPPCIHPIHNSHAGFRCSEKPTYEGQSDEDKDGEPGTGVTKGVPCRECEFDDIDWVPAQGQQAVKGE